MVNGDPAFLDRTASRSYFSADDKLAVYQKYGDASNPSRAGTYDEYRYDALGRRVMLRARTDSLCTNSHCVSAIERFVWDGSQILYELRFPGGDSLGGGGEEPPCDPERENCDPILRSTMSGDPLEYNTGGRNRIEKACINAELRMALRLANSKTLRETVDRAVENSMVVGRRHRTAERTNVERRRSACPYAEFAEAIFRLERFPSSPCYDHYVDQVADTGGCSCGSGFATASGAHYIFTKDGVEEILNLQPRGTGKGVPGPPGPDVIVKYKLGGSGEQEA